MNFERVGFGKIEGIVGSFGKYEFECSLNGGDFFCYKGLKILSEIMRDYKSLTSGREIRKIINRRKP